MSATTTSSSRTLALQSLRLAVKRYATSTNTTATTSTTATTTTVIFSRLFQSARPSTAYTTKMMRMTTAQHGAAIRTSSSTSSSSSAAAAAAAYYPYQKSMTRPPSLQQQAPQQQQQQQPQDLSYDNNNNNTTTTHYTSEFQDLFDQMEHDPRSSTLGVEEAYWDREEKRLECGIVESALRFKTTCYGGRLLRAPYVHPNEHRVVLCISIQDLGLTTDTEKWILQEIVGNRRLNHDRQELRLTSNQFGSRIENKRHLVSMLNRIVLSCRRLASEIVKNKEQDVEGSDNDDRDHDDDDRDDDDRDDNDNVNQV